MYARFIDDDHVLFELLLEMGPTLVGRSASNGVILKHPSVSGRHALLVRDEDGLLVRDQGSTNGTFVNGVRVFADVRVSIGDVVRFGTRIEMKVSASSEVAVTWLLYDASGKAAVPLNPEASVPECDVVVSVQNGQVELRGPQSVEMVPVDCLFEAGGRQWLVARANDEPTTEASTSDVLPYTLRVELHTPLAELLHEERRATVRSAPGVALLHVLSARLVAARLHGESPWVDDETLGRAIWGRSWGQQNPNSLNVLIHRVRKRATTTGFERWFIERRPGETRLRVREVTGI